MAEEGWTLHTHRASDGYSFHYRRYAPAATPRAHVVCLHGIQSHAGWYAYSCSRLARAGYLVSFLDRRGSGENTEARGDTPSFRRLIDDVAEFIRDQSTGPIFLHAVSWGGKLAVAIQRRHPGLVAGVILLCPGLFPQIKPPFIQRVGILLSRLVRPRTLFPIPLNDPDLFTATPHWLEFLRTDSLSLHHATARFLVESARLDMYLRWTPRHVTVPTLLQLAGKDRIINNSRTQLFIESFPGPKQIKLYYSAHHTLEFEPEPDEYIDDVIGWLNRISGLPC